ncbi:MAG: CotH kinase family protein [Clostridia bacterium]|nr:CotH kinase family protein [Clostridia bacterium]
MCVYVTDGEKVDYLCHDIYNNITQQEYASSLTFKFISEELAPKYDVAFTCDDTMGTLTGETSQIVREGDKSSAVTAVAKEGYQFACWSDGTTNATIEYSPKAKSELVAYFTPKSTGLPVFTIDTATGLSITSKDDYVDCEITLLDTETGNSIGGQAAEIKGRGNSTWDKFDKKPYKFKFEDKQNLFGYGKEKTWVLLADARDYSLVRNMLALNAGLSMSELGYTSMGQSVELYLNGEYRGVYYLCEQIQIKENRVNVTAEDEGADANQDGMVDPDSIGYLVEMDAWASDSSNKNLANYTKDGDVFVTITGGQKPFVIKDPEDVFFDADGNFDAEKAAPYLEYIQGYLQQCHDAMYADKTAENYEALCQLIDVKSFAQAYIIYEWFKNPDVNYSSVYYYKDANGKLVADPLWDFDMSVGNVTHKSGAGTNASSFRDTTFLWAKSQNYWFNQLLQFEEFKELVGQELNDNAATLRASVADSLAYAREHADAYEKNFEVWNLIGNTSATEAMGAWSVPAEFKAFATWEEHLTYIENYLEASLTHLINTYPAPAAESN